MMKIKVFSPDDDALEKIQKLKDMVLIPAGKFEMGSNDSYNNERPVHTVHLNAFYIDIYPVTNAQYRKFIEEVGYPEPFYLNDEKFNQPDQPVVGVSWHDAMAYADWAGKRIPTEAEWEKAARGGLVSKKYSWGDEEPDDKRANYDSNVGKTTSVGSYPPNGYGLYDMAGNVWEWCLDKYKDDFYQNSPRDNPLAERSLPELLTNYKSVKTLRIVRGGSWFSMPHCLRVANRAGEGPADRRTYKSILHCHGFRCVSPAFCGLRS